jgi:hypothetical protein
MYANTQMDTTPRSFQMSRYLNVTAIMQQRTVKGPALNGVEARPSQRISAKEIFATLKLSAGPGLPDGLFSNQKSKFG